MLDFFSKLFDTLDFPARWHCGAWTPGHGWLHILSDLGVWSAYVAIPLVLGYFILRRRDIPFRTLFVLFGAFIFACGTTHLMEAAIFWWPAYRLAGVIKLFTALVSWSTVIALVPITPRALAMRSPQELEREIEQRKRAEQRLEQYARELEAKNQQLVEAERVKGQVLANVSHELRTPLTLILAPVESLLGGEDGPLTDRQKSDLQAVHNNAIRLLQMVSGLLDFSKLEAGKTQVQRAPLEIVALTRAIYGDFQPLLQNQGLEGNFAATPGEAWVSIDRYQWERIVFNLLSNAIKFTPRGGRVAISLCVDAGRLQLTVSDTGIGIAAANLGKLFRRFGQLEGSATRRYEGTGLGLALVKEFAELLGGTVSVSSQQGRGSTFTVECPAPAAAPAIKLSDPRVSRGAVPRYEAVSFEQPSGATSENAEFKPQVLIAEDNSELASYISVLLSEFCETHVVRDGEEALTAIRTSPPRLVLADVMMPRRNGLSLCREIKAAAATAKIPVILLTALTHRAAMMQGWEAGADDYLFKPFHPKELKARVKSVLTAALERQRADDALLEMQTRLERLVEQRTAELAHSNAVLAEADRRKDEFLAMLAHELRNPLAPIANAVQLLRAPDQATGEVQWARDVIDRQVGHLRRLIDDLLDASRISRGKLEIRKQPVSLREVIDATIEASRPILEQSGHKLSVQVPSEPIPLDVDPVRLSQALMNLLNNAAKYTPRGGHVCLTAERDADGILVRVRDNGIGIPRDQLAQLFELFYQVDRSLERSQGGLGIGLSLARRVVERHGGTLEAHSEGEGRGSEFVVRLPIVEPSHAPPEPPDADKATVGAPRRILIADDNRDAAESLAMVLRGGRHEVRTAYDGAAALDVAARFRPQVVLMDLGMPKLNGYETALKMRAQPGGEEITLVALTGWGQDDDRRRSQDAGFDHHLIKPADLEKLAAILAETRSP